MTAAKPPDTPKDSVPSSKENISSFFRFRRFIGGFRLQTVITVSLVIIVITAISLTGFFTFLNSQYAVSNLASQIENQVSDRINLHLTMYLDIPHHINSLCADSIRLGEVNPDDNKALEKHFQELTYQYTMAEAICYGDQAEGNYTILSKVGAPGIANGTDLFLGYSRKDTNFSFEEYRINRNGKKLEKTVSIENYDPRTRLWYKSAVETQGPSWTPIYMWLEGVVGIDAVLPVYSENGDLLGVMDSALTLTGIGEFLQTLHISENGQAFIVDKDGYLIASSVIKEPYNRVDGKLVRMTAINSSNDVVNQVSEYISINHFISSNLSERRQFTLSLNEGRQLVQVAPFKDPYGLSWYIVVVIPESDFMHEINNSNKVAGFLILIAILITVFICILLARWITKPLAIMNNSARALAGGDWSAWQELDRRDELGQLSHSFKLMADQLRVSFSSLKESEERYMSLFQSSADPILLFKSFTLLNINPAGEKMFAVSGQDTIGMDIRELFGDVGIAIGDMIDLSVTSGNGAYQDLSISQTYDGKERYMNIRATRMVDKDELLTLVHIRDITEQRMAIIMYAEQDALRESFDKIHMILQHLPDPTFVIDKNGNVLYWNRALENLSNITADDVTGKGYDYYSKAILGTGKPLLANLVLNPDLVSDEFYPYIEKSGDTLSTSYWLTLSGEMKFISVIASRLYNSEGEVLGAIESIRDITSHKMAEEGLLMANKKLNLLSSITRHDIINKIMVSKGYLALLQDSSPDTGNMSLIEGIKRSLDDIDHFVAFTRTYQELGMKAPVWQDVGEVCNRAIIDIQTGKVTIHNTIIGLSILADSLFEKVCYNLMENAIRHGEKLTRIDIFSRDTENGVRITIEDDGIGVADDQKELIFERGFGKNTGYGLFLVREILSISGITIVEKGEYGNGCRFEIDVPKGRFRKE